MIMLVALGGVVLGSKDVMAVSRAWGHSFYGLRRLHSMRSVPFYNSRPHPTFEPIVQQSSLSSGHLRFIAHAAALEESSELSHRKGSRLSRAERYALVESFVLKHKHTHEGNWPSITAILKETGGSRLVVKDILEELEKKVKGYSEVEAPDSENSERGAPESEDETLQEFLPRYESARQPSHSPDEVEEIVHDEPILDGPSAETDDLDSDEPGISTVQSREIRTDPGLWSRLRNLGNVEQSETRDKSSSSPAFEEFESDAEEDANEAELSVDDFDENKDVGQRDQTKSSRTSSESVPGDSYGLFIRFLPLAATEHDLRAAFEDCGEIVRAQAMLPKGSGLKFTYGFVDFSTLEGLSKALNKDKVSIRGSIILTEACSPRRAELRTPSARRPPPEHFKKNESPRNSDRNVERPTNGFRGPATSKFRRGDSQAVSENSSHPASQNGSFLVAVEGLSYPMPMSAVEKILSAHGAIYRSELAREDGGTYSALVEFKTEEGRNSALAAGRVYLAGRWCRISTGEPILTTVVRLSNVGNVSENFILQRCGKLGRVGNIVQRKEGVVDVYYHPSERRNMKKILDRLGEANADFKRWHVNIAPKCSSEEIRNSPEIQDWVEAQKDRLLENLTGAMKLMIIDLEDLRELVDTDRNERSMNGNHRNGVRSPGAKLNRL